MSDGTIVLLVAVAWLAIGLAVTVVMGRRGHNAVGWAVIGMLLGPFGILFAVEGVWDEKGRMPETLTSGAPAAGAVDVLVGIDGSPEAAAALDAAIELLGSRVHRLALAAVRDYDAIPANDRVLRADLEHQRARFDERYGDGHERCSTMLLTGQPAAALTAEAVAGGYDLLVIGARGHGLTKAVLGSVASQLAAHSKVPVLIAGSSR